MLRWICIEVVSIVIRGARLTALNIRSRACWRGVVGPGVIQSYLAKSFKVIRCSRVKGWRFLATTT